MRQDAQKPDRKFCVRKTAKKRKTHPVWAKKGETGCVLGAGGDESGCRQVQTEAKCEGEGKNLSRLPPRSVRGRAPLALAHPTTRTARGAAAPRCLDIPPTNEKSQVSQKRYLTFLAGAEGLEPSARGFGVDVETAHKEQERGSVARFPCSKLKSVVLVWCFENIYKVCQSDWDFRY